MNRKDIRCVNCLILDFTKMGQSRTQRRRQQRNKKKKADAAAAASASEAKSSIKPFTSLFEFGRTNYHDDLQKLWDIHNQLPPYVPQLFPRFPEERETLSLDAGFAQTPALKCMYNVSYYLINFFFLDRL